MGEEPSGAEEDSEALRVLTLNLWHRSGDWPARREAIVRGISQLAPDVVGFQEVEALERDDGSIANQAEEIAVRCGMRMTYGVSHSSALPDGGRRHFGNAVLSRFPVTRSTCRPLPEGRRDEPRSVLHCVLGTPWGPVPVFVTHLAWRLDAGSDRVRQVRYLVRIVDELCPREAQGFPPVLLGDLNAEPDTDEIRYLTGLSSLRPPADRFADAWRYGGAGPGYTYDPVNPFAALSEEPARRIDYILVRGPGDDGLGRPRNPRLALAHPYDGVHASDHFGVVTNLEVP